MSHDLSARVFAGALVRTAVAVLAFFTIFPASARDLTSIDRLGDAPPRAGPASLKSANAPDEAMQFHSRLGVPTFLWAQRGGAVADKVAATSASVPADPVVAARAYLRNLGALYALPGERVDPMPVLYTQTLPNGGAIVKFRNRINSIDVFREEAAVLLGPDRQLVAIGGFLMGGDGTAPFKAGPAAAVAVALLDWSFSADTAARLTATETRGDYQYFDLPAGTASDDGSQLNSPVRVKPVLFRLPDQLIPAYYIEVQVSDGAQPGAVDGYAYVIAAGDLSVLYRHNQTADASFTYRVFAEPTGNNLPLPNPSGRNGFPHPTAIPDGYQGPFVAPNLVALQNAPFSRNDPWLPPGATQTTGNNVDAFADTSAPDGFSPGDLRASTTSPSTFDRTYDTAQAPNAGSSPIMASVTNLFYMNNWLHDWYYDAGFDEVSGNAQADNYGRGGIAGDSIFAEAQDFAARNNANMLTPADGGRPRMRMYVFDSAQVLTATVNTPAAIAGVKTSAGAAFGPRAFNVTANLVYAIPAIGCTALTNAAAISGKIALIDRGSCTFKTKVINAQNAGATGVIIVNNLPAGVSGMGDDPTITASVTIAAVMVAQADGAAIKGQLPAPGVNVQLQSITGPDRDGSVDNTIIAHEWGHYISNRLIADASGLTTIQARGMSEGWADFHSLLLLVKAGDSALPNNVNFAGTYAVGAYALGGPPDPQNSSYYYGIRRYPYSRDMTKNPLTFKHITAGVPLPASPPPHSGADGSQNAEVHNTGEIWASMLWECYSNLLDDTARLTFDQAQDRMKRYLVLGYKLTPSTPTFTEARDALLAAIAAQDSQDYALCYQGFAKRGAGIGAVAPDRFDADNAGVVESFVAGGALSIVSATITDAPGYCDADGILGNGENGALQVTLHNSGTTALSATTGSVSSGNSHLTFPSGTSLTIPPSNPGQTLTVTLPVHLAGASGVESAGITVTVDDPGLNIARPVTTLASFWINADQKANQSATDDVETTHTAWTTGSTIANATPSLLWKRIAVTSIDHRWLGPDAGIPQLTWLQSPPLNVAASGNFTFTFRHRFSFDNEGGGAFDGGQIQISTNGGSAWTDIGVSASPGYNGTMAVYSGNLNPLAGLPGYVRTNPAYPALETVTVNLGTTYAAQTVLIRFAIGTDNSAPAGGWDIDDIAFSNITNTPFDALVAHAAACYTVTPQAGTPQWALVGTAFGTALKALVKDGGGTPVPGVPVTFAAPGSGASATFGGAATVNTDGGGVATAPTLTANGIAGSYHVTASAGLQSASFALVNTVASPSIDIDGNSNYDALTDGLLIIRYLFGLTGTSLTSGALGTGATRTTLVAIAQYMDDILPLLDVDGNGQSDALTDGLMLIRYLFGLRGPSLITGAVGTGATRNTAMQIETYIQSLMP